MLTAPDIVAVVLRALALILLYQAAGMAIFDVAFGARLGTPDATRLRSAGAGACLGAAVLVCGHYLMQPARMAGAFAGILDSSLQGMVLHSPSGAALALRLAGLILILVSMLSSQGGRRIAASLGVLLLAVAFALTGHTSVHTHRPVLATLLVVHVLIGMFWFGALVPLWLSAGRDPGPQTAGLIAAFSAAAVWIVPLILLAGLLMTALLVPGLAAFTQPYGQLLIVKVCLFAVLMGLAAANKWRFGPAISAGNALATRRFRISLVLEFALICVVLAVTACLTTFFSPE